MSLPNPKASLPPSKSPRTHPQETDDKSIVPFEARLSPESTVPKPRAPREKRTRAKDGAWSFDDALLDARDILSDWILDFWAQRKRAPSYLFGSLVIACSLIVIAGLTAIGLAIASSFKKEEATLVATPKQKSTPGGILTAAEAEATREVVVGFLAAPTVREKLQFVRHPARVEAAMGAFYNSPENANKLNARTAGPTLKATKTIFGSAETIVIAFDVFPESKPQIFLVEKIDSDTYRLDWESSSGYQEMPLTTFKSERPTEPQAFRVHATAGDYYNFGFSEDTHQCYVLTYPLDPDFQLYGYVLRDSDTATRLQSIFPPMAIGTHPSGVILDLAYPADSSPAAVENVEIHAIKLDHWMIP